MDIMNKIFKNLTELGKSAHRADEQVKKSKKDSEKEYDYTMELMSTNEEMIKMMKAMQA